MAFAEDYASIFKGLGTAGNSMILSFALTAQKQKVTLLNEHLDRDRVILCSLSYNQIFNATSSFCYLTSHILVGFALFSPVTPEEMLVERSSLLYIKRTRVETH